MTGGAWTGTIPKDTIEKNSDERSNVTRYTELTLPAFNLKHVRVIRQVWII